MKVWILSGLLMTQTCTEINSKARVDAFNSEASCRQALKSLQESKKYDNVSGSCVTVDYLLESPKDYK